MKFDSIIIGGGVAGLSCALRCQQAGLNVAIISSGQSAFHFSSGSIDLLSHLPDGQWVDHPFEGIKLLTEQAPNHPYSHLGIDTIKEAFMWFQQLTSQLGVTLKPVMPPVPNAPEVNHFRLTPLGTFRASWLSPEYVYPFTLDLKHPFKRIALVSIAGFRDFYPNLAADNLSQIPQFQDCEILTIQLNLNFMTQLEHNYCELRSIDLAHLLESQPYFDQFAQVLKETVGFADLVVLPAIFEQQQSIAMLQNKTGFRLCELPTMPPSLLGIRIELALKSYFINQGGTFLPGDTVLSGEFNTHKNGSSQLTKIFTKNHGDFPFCADNYLIANGSFFSSGLASSRQKIFEPVFDLDLFTVADREQWSEPQFFSKQPHRFLSMGVVVTPQFQAQRQQKIIDNLYCAGAMLAHYDPITEGSGSGVAISTGFYTANEMIKKHNQKDAS